MATYILTFADGRDDELVADMYREDPPFIELIALPPGNQPRLVASYLDAEIVRIARKA